MVTNKRPGLLATNDSGDDLYWDDLALPIRWVTILILSLLTIVLIWVAVLTGKFLIWLIT